MPNPQHDCRRRAAAAQGTPSTGLPAAWPRHARRLTGVMVLALAVGLLALPAPAAAGAVGGPSAPAAGDGSEPPAPAVAQAGGGPSAGGPAAGDPAPLVPAGTVEPRTVAVSREDLGTLAREHVGPVEIYRLPGQGLGPFDLVVTGDSLWLTLFGREGKGEVGLGRVDPAGARAERFVLPEGVVPYTLRAAPDGSLWVTDYEFSPEPRQRHVLRIDPAAAVATLYPLPEPTDGATDFAFAPDGSIWLANYQTNGLLRLDPTTGSFSRLTTPLPETEQERTVFTGALRLALVDGRLWAVESVRDRLVRVDLPGGGDEPRLAVLPLPLGVNSPVGIVVDDGTIWTTEHPGSRLLHWRPEDGSARSILLWPTDEEGYPVAGPNDLVAGRDGSIWAVVHFVGRLARVLPDGRTVNELFLAPVLGLPPTRVLPLWGDVDGEGGVWTAAYGADALIRVAPDAPTAAVDVDVTEVTLQAGGEAATVQLQITFSPGRWPAEWSNLEVALAGDDLPEGVRVEARPSHVRAWPGETVRATLTIQAGREVPPGDYDVVAGVRTTLFAAHRTLRLHIAPVPPLGGIWALIGGITLLWLLALATAWTLARQEQR